MRSLYVPTSVLEFIVILIEGRIRTQELIVNVPRANTQAPQISRSGDLDLGSNFDRGARPDEPNEPSPGKGLKIIKQLFHRF